MEAHRPIGFWLKLVDSLITEQFAASLEEHGVTRLQWQLLNILSKGPASGDELSSMLAPFLATVAGPDEPTELEEHLSELVESSWVALEQQSYSLTEHGASNLSRLGEVVDSLREKSTAGISPTDYEAVIQTLERMAGNLGWREADPR
jgi:hypothetical protein